MVIKHGSLQDALMQVASGEHFPPPVPVETPFSTTQTTALAYGAPAGTPKKLLISDDISLIAAPV